MTMSQAEYDNRLAHINATWPEDTYPLLRGEAIKELDQQRRDSTYAPDTAVRDLARQYAASMPYQEAVKRAAEVIAAETGDIEAMSPADLKAHLLTMDPSVIYEQRVPEDITPEQAAAIIEAHEVGMQGGAAAKALRRQEDAEASVALSSMVESGMDISLAKQKLAERTPTTKPADPAPDLSQKSLADMSADELAAVVDSLK